MNDLISIIIPVYNMEKYLKQCVDSVLNQTYSNLEIFLVDDGSTDNSPQICDEYALIDSRIRVIHKANGGVGSARNYALDSLQGNYIFLLDSDDYIESNCIEQMHARIKKDQSSICICSYYMLENDVLGDKIPLKDTIMTADEFRSFFYSHVSFCAQTAFRLYSNDIFSDIRYPNLSYGEDAYIMLEIMNKVDKVSFIESPLCVYRRSNSSITYTSVNNYDKVIHNENTWWDLHISYYENNKMLLHLFHAMHSYCHVMLYMWKSLSKKNKKTYAPIIKRRCLMVISSKYVDIKTQLKYLCCLISISLCAKLTVH